MMLINYYATPFKVALLTTRIFWMSHEYLLIYFQVTGCITTDVRQH